MSKELQIIPPDGYEIDKNKSTLERIVFKEVKKKLSYEDIAKALFYKDYCEKMFYIGNDGGIEGNETGVNMDRMEDPNNSVSENQLQSILALNKLCNVAKYLNEDWLPQLSSDHGWSIQINNSGTIEIDEWFSFLSSMVYFKSEDLALQAIEILGEDEIRKALTLNY